MIPYSFVAFGHQIPQKIPRCASRARMLHFPMVLLFFSPHAKKETRRASRAGLLHFPMFCSLFDPKYPIFPARFARRIVSFPYGFPAF